MRSVHEGVRLSLNLDHKRCGEKAAIVSNELLLLSEAGYSGIDPVHVRSHATYFFSYSFCGDKKTCKSTISSHLRGVLEVSPGLYVKVGRTAWPFCKDAFRPSFKPSSNEGVLSSLTCRY